MIKKIIFLAMVFVASFILFGIKVNAAEAKCIYGMYTVTRTEEDIILTSNNPQYSIKDQAMLRLNDVEESDGKYYCRPHLYIKTEINNQTQKRVVTASFDDKAIPGSIGIKLSNMVNALPLDESKIPNEDEPTVGEATCKYGKYSVTRSGNNIDIVSTGNHDSIDNKGAIRVDDVKFENGKYYCPSVLYIKTKLEGTTYKISVSFLTSSYTQSTPIMLSEKTNAEVYTITEKKDGEDKPGSGEVTCYYGEIGITRKGYSTTSFSSNPNTPIGNDYFINYGDIPYASNNYVCPDKLYVTYSTSPIDGKKYATISFRTENLPAGYTTISRTSSIVTDATSPNGEKVSDIPSGQALTCDDFILVDGINIVNYLFGIMLVVAPILLIIFGSIDFAKAALSIDDKAMRKAGTNFMKRVIATILLMLLPLILNIIFGIAANAGVFGENNEKPEICTVNE